MNYFDKKETDRIERLEKKLFSKNVSFNGDIRSEFDQKQYEQKPDWDDGDLLETNLNETLIVKKPKTGIFWSVLVFAVLFFLGSLGYAAYMFIGGQKIISTDNVSIDIVGPVTIGGGDKLSIDVVIQNNGAVQMQATNLVVDYPEGTKTPDLQNDLKRDRIDIGNVGVNSVIKKTLDLAFLGENGEIKSVDITAEYQTPGSVALLKKTKTFTITLSVAPVQILVTAVEKISSGQEINFDLEIRSNSEKNIENLLVVAEYPFGFKFEKASISPTYGNNVWQFDNFSPTDVKNIKITGELLAQDNEQRSFKFSAGTPKSENKEELGITLTNVRHTVTIEKPFIGLDLVINNSNESVVAVKSGTQISYNLIFSNNTNNIVRDIEARLYFDGPVLDKNQVVVSGGFYSSSENKITYTKNTMESLASVEPRNNVNIFDKIGSYNLSSNNRNLVNPEIRISAVVTGIRTSESGVDEKIEQKDFVTIKIISDLVLDSLTSYNSNYTKMASFVDVGQVPPKIDSETVYTIVWMIKNSSNDLENTKIIGFLPYYVSWLDNLYPKEEKLFFDQTSRRIIWEPGYVGAGIGYNNIQPRFVMFQVKLTPSLSQIGQRPNLVEKVNVTAFDKFTKEKLDLIGPDVTTILFNRDAFDGHGNVVQ